MGLWVVLDTNASLGDLGLTSLLSVGEHLQIRANDALGSLDGLSALTTVGTFVSLQDNPLLSARRSRPSSSVSASDRGG